MAKRRVHEIAKSQEITSKDLLGLLKASGIEAKSASSSVDEQAALKAIAAKGSKAAGAEAKRAPAKQATKGAAPAKDDPTKAPPAAAAPAAPAPSQGRPAPERASTPGREQSATQPARPAGAGPQAAGGAGRPQAAHGRAATGNGSPPSAERRGGAGERTGNGGAAPKAAPGPARERPSNGAPGGTSSRQAPSDERRPREGGRPPGMSGGPANGGGRATRPGERGGGPGGRPAGPGGRPAGGGGRPAGPGGGPAGGRSAQSGRPEGSGGRQAGPGRGPGGERRPGGQGPRGASRGPGGPPGQRREPGQRRPEGGPHGGGAPQRPPGDGERSPGGGPTANGGPAAPGRDGQARHNRPTRDSRTGERAFGGGPAGRRRVVIDSQASRRQQGGQPPAQQPAKRPRRGRRRRGTYDDTVAPLEVSQAGADNGGLVRVNSGSTVKDVAEYLNVPVPEVIKKLMALGEMATLTQSLSDEAIALVAEELGREVEVVRAADDADSEPAFEDSAEQLQARPPVVTIMGHVDHGKTSLLDAIRESEVALGEAGGITQHIGAYQVHHGGKAVTFLDTPGHEAFTAMRARGARVTDVAVIVVAADDGVKPQTEEAIDHAKAAGVPVIVAVNKIDKEGAQPDRVRAEMAQHGLQPVEWGGEVEFVDVSAKTHVGLENLLDTIQVVADLAELSANPDAPASGAVIESKLDPGRGPVVTILIQRGSLHVGDALVAGVTFGRVRAMHDWNGARIKRARPGEPVEVLGFDGVPEAGEVVRCVESERRARQLAGERAIRLKSEALARRAGRKISLEDVLRLAREGAVKALNLVIKADVAGSLEAIEDEIAKLPQGEVSVNVIHRGVGGINESDVMLAAASTGLILGFNVRPVGDARRLAEQQGVEIRSYSVIYRAIEDLRAAMQGMLEPEEVESAIGQVEIRQLFKASRVGTIAGSYVTEGRIGRGSKVRVVRDGTVIYDTTIGSLRRFNEDAGEVASGFECGIVLDSFQDLREGDVLEAYEVRSVERALT